MSCGISKIIINIILPEFWARGLFIRKLKFTKPMTKQSRRKFSADLKVMIALEAIKYQKTLTELSQQFSMTSGY